YAPASEYHICRDSFHTSEFIFIMEYLFQQGLKKPDIPMPGGKPSATAPYSGTFCLPLQAKPG
ncbi:hypothetical protein, partial [Klebsiella pneumoniae]|uniref:hypothetical protein n=1 Tax=Klebsiella pneumoniae TaxID=573 RepID=UPI000D58E2AD